MALTFMENVVQQTPELAEPLAQCIDLYRKKLFHQLTDLIEQLTSTQLRSLNWIEVHEGFIQDFREHLNRLRYAQFLVVTSETEPNLEAASTYIQSGLDFLEAAKSTPETEGAQILLRCQKLHLELLDCRAREADTKHIKQQLSQIGDELEGSTKQVMSASVPSLYHRVSAFYFQGEQDFTNVYYHGIRFLSYTETDGLHDLDQWVHDIAIAAIVAPSFYDFGELSLNPSIEALGDSWVSQLLQIFIRAVPDEYNAFCAANAEVLNSDAVVGPRKSTMDEKIRLLALVKLAFSKESASRVLSFSEVAATTQDDQVELMLMRAMSLKLIGGKIDELDRTVSVTYVKPRILGLDEIEASTRKVAQWANELEGFEAEILGVMVENGLEKS